MLNSKGKLLIYEKRIDKIMELPASYDRGVKMAAIINDLTIANQKVLHFNLGYSFDRINKLYSAD